ncbi:MAG: hypothetical protein QM632_00290 [Micrococcaceae bacterium]
MGNKKSKLLMGLAILSLLAGLALLTIFAPPKKITSTVELNQSGPVAYATSDLYNTQNGQADIEVDGPGKIFVGQASDADIKSWVANAAHTEITGLNKDNSAQQNFVDGEKTVPNPDGADIWISQNTGDKVLTTQWKNPDANTKWGLLVASDGTQPVPKTITFTWNNTHKNPFAWPLVSLGLLLAAASWYMKDQESDPLAQELKKAKKAKKTKTVQATGAQAVTEPIEQLDTVPHSAHLRTTSSPQHHSAQTLFPHQETLHTANTAQHGSISYNGIVQQQDPTNLEDIPTFDPDLYLDDDEEDAPLPSRRQLREKGEL